MHALSLPKRRVGPAVVICSLLLSTSALAEVAATISNDPPEPVKSGTGPVSYEADNATDIVVVAESARGSAQGNIQPEIQLDPADIRALGVSSMQDVLEQLGPQLTSGGGRGGERPVVLVNGKRVSGFRDIQTIPPEAIERVEILPEEVSLTYGYPATQKVMNIVLRKQFRALTTEVKGGMPTAGGRGEGSVQTNIVNIKGDNRLTIDLGYSRQGMILESERDIISRTSGSMTGNILPAGASTEIDPALSALAGKTVTVAAVPATAATGKPGLTDFLAGANAPTVSNQGPYRSLVDATQTLSAGASLSRPMGAMQATFSASLNATNSQGLQGLPQATLLLPAGNPFSPFGTDVTVSRLSDSADALERDSRNWTGRLATAIVGRLGAYQLSVNGSWEHSESRSLTDRGLDLSALSQRILNNDPAANPFASGVISGPLRQDRSNSNTDYANIDTLLSGEIVSLPAGGVRTSLKAGFEWRDISSSSVRSGLAQAVDLNRSSGNGQLSVDIPLTSRRNDVLAAVGDISVNLNAAASQLSDFGTLTTWGVGGRWSPIAPLGLSASFTREEGPPSITQLGNPNIITPNVRVFDFIRGETVLVNRLDGGNPGLTSDHRRVVKLGANWQVRRSDKTTVTALANYTDSRIDDPIASFPTATAELETAFPGRFMRDSNGRLIQIDNRPLNFQQTHTRELRWGINLMQKIMPSASERAAMETRMAEMKKRREAAEAERKQAEAEGRTPPTPPGRSSIFGGAGGPGGQGMARGPGGPGGGGGSMGQGRLMFSLFHTWRFQNSILIRDGVPELDLLNGSAVGSMGGVPRHELEGRLMVSKNGLGARAAVNWLAPTDVLVHPGGAPSNDDLRFSSYGKVNLALFADLGQQRSLVRASPFFRSSRLSLSVDNLFDARPRVSDRTGATPIAYQADLLDPVGRRIELSFRKLFF